MEQKGSAGVDVDPGEALDSTLVQGVEPSQKSHIGEGEPEVSELAGQVKEALTPVKAPSSVKDKLRVELVEVAQRRQAQDMRVESPSRRREWAIGAVVGSAMALVGGALYLLRKRIEGRGAGVDNQV